MRTRIQSVHSNNYLGYLYLSTRSSEHLELDSTPSPPSVASSPRMVKLWRERSRSGLLANSVCVLLANVFCGVLRSCFASFFFFNSVLRCFAGGLRLFGRVVRMFFVKIF